jgi:hypothetical protein
MLMVMNTLNVTLSSEMASLVRLIADVTGLTTDQVIQASLDNYWNGGLELRRRIAQQPQRGGLN